MNYLLFGLPGNEKLTASLASLLPAQQGDVTIRQFPDGETYVKLNTEVQGRALLLVCTLYQPDTKLLPLYFVAKTAKELGAASITLVAPYLAYMRQDKRFKEGEGITNRYFASLLSTFADKMLTIDPHLHRVHHIRELFTIPVTVLHAAPTIASYVRQKIEKPLFIGPDEESRQWVSEVAGMAKAPFIVLNKTRTGDRQVQIEVPDIDAYKDYTPVLVDDIISTARTMIETIHHLKAVMLKPPVCIGVHGIFAGDAYEALLQAGAAAILTCNTILHPTNQIYLDKVLAEAIQDNKV